MACREEVKVSVVIPVYNTETYLKKCLNSVRNQTLREIEMICVDDGSTDGSLRILEEYARADSRIKVIHKENGGLVSARKAGVALAVGQYTGYVDSDDWIDSGMYEYLYRTALQNQADMVSSGYFFEGNYITEHFDGVQEGLYDEHGIAFLRENAIYNMKTQDVGIRGSLCCKLFRTDLLKEVQGKISERLSFSEDKICMLSYILQCKRVYVLKKAFYHYIVRQSSMVHAADVRYLICLNEIYKSFTELYSHPYFTHSMRMQAELYIVEQLYKGVNSRLGFENDNLFWLDPYYLEKLPRNARIVLYGGSELGKAYRKQLLKRKDLELVGCVDPAYEKMEQSGITVCSPDMLTQWEYDFVLITVKNPMKASDIQQDLEKTGIPREKIRWYEQKEIFWKFAEANWGKA